MTQQHLIAQYTLLSQDYQIAKGAYHWRHTYANRLQMVRARLAARQWKWYLFGDQP